MQDSENRTIHQAPEGTPAPSLTDLESDLKAMQDAQAQQAQNPVIFADVPDMSMIRVGNNFYMTSTTMHMSPGVPVMKSTDLVNWKLINYVYDTLANLDQLNLTDGKSTYGRGSWASSIRYHKGTYYVTTFAQTTGKTHVYTTKNIEAGNSSSTR